MTQRILFVQVVLLLVGVAPVHAAKVIECTNPATDDKFKMSMREIKQSVKILTKELGREQVHMLDLPEEAQNDSRGLPAALAAEDWCKAANYARSIEDAIYGTRVHSEFVNQKFSRVELWVRAGDWDPATKMAAERLIALAAAKISEGEHVAANAQLNKTINTIFGTKGLWELPESLPDVSAAVEGGAKAVVNEDDVAGGCPKLAAKGRGNADDLTEVKKRVKRAMNQRQVRTTDIKGGEALAGDLDSYTKLKAIWPAIRVGCALLHKTKTLEIGLGVTMARYHRVNKMRREKELSEEEQKRFSELVRVISDAVAATDYETAFANLERAFVILGAPASAGDTLGDTLEITD